MNDVQVSRWMKCLKNIAKVENFVLLSVRSKYFCIFFLVCWMKVLFQMNQQTVWRIQQMLFFFSVMKDGFAKSMICFKNTTNVEVFLLLWSIFFFKQILVLMYGFFFCDQCRFSFRWMMYKFLDGWSVWRI